MVLTFELSVCLLQLQNFFIRLFLICIFKYFKLDPNSDADPHGKKPLEPDPTKINADP